tara:strand:- start:332 stop:688 length:357 start_codon:yes stop_codon:yes gene_type:complete
MNIGVDIVDIERFEKALLRHGDRFIKRLFTDREQSYAEKSPAKRLERYAVRFAAKEAVFKALPGEKTLSWHDIETLNTEDGVPQIYLYNRLKEKYGNLDIKISFSHSCSQAIATCLVS